MKKLPLLDFAVLVFKIPIASQASAPKPASIVPQAICYADAYNDPILSDVVLKAGETRIHAHRVVLSSHSPSFKAMFLVRHSK